MYIPIVGGNLIPQQGGGVSGGKGDKPVLLLFNGLKMYLFEIVLILEPI